MKTNKINLNGYTELLPFMKPYIDTFGKAANMVDLDIVSVGSGNAVFENSLIKNGVIKEVICIDPHPASYCKEPVEIKPMFNNICELIASKPDIVGNCVLIIVRASPMLEYDIEAVEALRPRMIFCLYKADGADGSMAFHSFLKGNVKPSMIQQTDFGLGTADKHDLIKLSGSLPMYEGNEIHFTYVLPDKSNCHAPTCCILVRGGKLLNFRKEFMTSLISGEMNPDPPSKNEIAYAINTSLKNAMIKAFGMV
jgi:hypothetical protein